MRDIARSVLKPVQRTLNGARYPRFQKMIDDVGGMMPPKVYSRMYDEAKALPDGAILEVGPYRGASTIAMAWGRQDSGSSGPIVTCEKADGGQWEDAHQTHEDNIDVLRSNYARHGVADMITVFPEAVADTNRDEVVALLDGQEVVAFFHDADGHIERDFALFWSLVRPGGLIIVDDYRETTVKYQRPSSRRPQGGIKGPLTFRLLNQFTEWGLFEPTATLGETCFGTKPVGADFSRFDPAVCEEIFQGVIRDRDAFLDAAGR